MELFDVSNTLFTIGGQGVSFIELFAVLLGISCVFMATRGKVLNFWLGYLYNIFLFFMFMQKHLFSSMLLQPVSFVINIFGHYRWTHPKENEKDKANQLKITLLTNKERVLYIGVIVVFTFAWGLVLANLHNWFSIFPPARTPYLDACVTGLILMAQFLSAKKKLDCWALWFSVNVTNTILYISVGLKFMPIVSASYLLLAFFGFRMWRKKMNEEC